VQRGRIPNERVPKRRLGFIDRHRCHLPQIVDTNQHVGREQAAPRRDDERPAESRGIGELSAEVEAAHEREDFAERRADIGEARGQRARLTLEQHLRASARAAGGGQQEHRQHATAPCNDARKRSPRQRSQ